MADSQGATGTPRRLVYGLLALGVLLTATIVPAPFTVDENHYLASVIAIRSGQLTVPGTEGFSASRELYSFDPLGHSRALVPPPVATTVPPLYGLIALPFLVLGGWVGLVVLNTVSFLLTSCLVFAMAGRLGSLRAQWFAAGTFLFACSSLEYAQGVWPHSLSVLTTTGCFFAALRGRELRGQGSVYRWLLLAGLLGGVAAGLRYQNILFVGLVGLGLLLSSRRWWSAGLLFGLGVGLPLLASSVLNHWRLETWNPITKGPRYFVAGSNHSPESSVDLADVGTMFWARVVDYAVRPEPGGPDRWFERHAPSNVYLVYGAVKKSLLQSGPWVIVGLAGLILAAWRWLRAGLGRGAVSQESRLLGSALLVVGGVLVAFALFGSRRNDGLCFNQRYFLELLPLVVLGFVAMVRDHLTPSHSWGLGAVLGSMVALVSLDHFYSILRWGPLVLCFGLLILMLMRQRRSATRWWQGMLAASLAWSLVVHLGDDLVASRELRQLNLERLATVAPFLPKRASVFAWGAAADAMGPLWIDRDVVLLNPKLDDGQSMDQLIAESFAGGRAVVIAAEPDPLARDSSSHWFQDSRFANGATRLFSGPPLDLARVDQKAESLP